MVQARRSPWSYQHQVPRNTGVRLHSAFVSVFSLRHGMNFKLGWMPRVPRMLIPVHQSYLSLFPSSSDLSWQQGILKSPRSQVSPVEMTNSSSLWVIYDSVVFKCQGLWRLQQWVVGQLPRSAVALLTTSSTFQSPVRPVSRFENLRFTEKVRSFRSVMRYSQILHGLEIRGHIIWRPSRHRKPKKMPAMRFSLT